MTRILIFLLMLVSGVVFVLQVRREKRAWLFICIYWAILTIKNAVDFFGGIR